MEYSNKELNEIREAGYNHGYDVGYNEGYYDSIKNIITEIEKLSQKRCEIDLRHTKAECDKGWAVGEMNAFHMILNHIKILEQENIKTSKRNTLTRKEQGKIICEHLKHDGDDLDESVMISSVWDALKEIEKINGSKDIKESKIIIGYDDFGKPLHEGDFCTFDVDVTNWRFNPDNIRKSGLATLEGQVTYNEQDKCYELSIDNDYCPALYFHAIEPGTLRVKETKEQTKEQSFRKNNKDIER